VSREWCRSSTQKYAPRNDGPPLHALGYRPLTGELWRHREAKARAVVEGGKVKAVEVTDPGAGYNTPPTATVRGIGDVELVVTLLFDKDLKKNGSIKATEVKAAK
jgi:hypothetical protein